MVTFAANETKEYKEYVKAKLKQDKINKKIAELKLRKEDAKRYAEIGPAWYQGLSVKQIQAIQALGHGLWADIEEGVPVRTKKILVKLGICPRPTDETLLHAMKRCYMNPIIFLLYLYKIYGTTPLDTNAQYFCVNDRLILTAMSHLALPRTLAELCLRLPHIHPPLIKYPVVCPTQFLKTESPYLDLQQFYMNCVRDEEREAIRKRQEYLKKYHALKKEIQEPIFPYIRLFSNYHSMRYDGRDEIPTEGLAKQKQVKQRKKLVLSPKKAKTRKQAVHSPKKAKTRKQSAKETSEASEEPERPSNLLYHLLCKSDLELLKHKSMRLPEPILTEQTIIALVAGYWQTIYGPFTPPSPTQEEQELAEKGGVRVMMCLAKGALGRMARRGNPLAALQDSHTLPEIKQLVRQLCSFQLTSKYKDYLRGKSARSWNVSLIYTPQIPCIPLQFKDGFSLTWGSIYSFKKRNNEHKENYLNTVSKSMVDDAREFWSSMATDYFNMPGFRDIHFTYLPSRIEDIVFKYNN